MHKTQHKHCLTPSQAYHNDHQMLVPNFFPLRKRKKDFNFVIDNACLYVRFFPFVSCQKHTIAPVSEHQTILKTIVWLTWSNGLDKKYWWCMRVLLVCTWGCAHPCYSNWTQKNMIAPLLGSKTNPKAIVTLTKKGHLDPCAHPCAHDFYVHTSVHMVEKNTLWLMLRLFWASFMMRTMGQSWNLDGDLKKNYVHTCVHINMCTHVHTSVHINFLRIVIIFWWLVLYSHHIWTPKQSHYRPGSIKLK